MTTLNPSDDPGTPEYGQGVPQNAVVIKIGSNHYRVIWSLGGQLGYAWYSASANMLQNIFGPNWQGQVEETFPTIDAFTAKYGNFYWGSIAEVDLTAETPWEDLMSSILESFGEIPGISHSPEVQRLAVQGYFEQWTANEFQAHYHQTTYWNNLNTIRENWLGLSQAEQNRLTRQAAGELVDIYYRMWGRMPEGGRQNAEIQEWAEKIASGRRDLWAWENRMRRQASRVEGTTRQGQLLLLLELAPSLPFQ